MHSVERKNPSWSLLVPHGRGLTPHFCGCVLFFFFSLYFVFFRKSAAFVLIFLPNARNFFCLISRELVAEPEEKVRAVFCIVTCVSLLVNYWLMIGYGTIFMVILHYSLYMYVMYIMTADGCHISTEYNLGRYHLVMVPDFNIQISAVDHVPVDPMDGWS